MAAGLTVFFSFRRLPLVVSALFFVASTTLAQPSFDCAKASSQVEELICKTDALAALDRELSEAWPKALANLPEDDRAAERAFQRGWIEGRNDCWKSDDIGRCVSDEYQRRITQLQIRGGLVMVPDYVSFQCEDHLPLTATFYTNTRVPAAVLTHGDEQTIAFRVQTGSGSKYSAGNVTFWEHQGEVTYTWLDGETKCKKLG